MRRRYPVFIAALAACGSNTKPPLGSQDAPSTVDASRDASPDAPDKAAACATTFGTSLTAAFGRIDGTVLAVVPPGDQACTAPNATHLVIQLTMNGEAYRLVVDVLSNQGSPDVWFDELDAPLVAGPWAEGWHAGVALDYVTDLAVASTAFTEMQEAPLVAKITSELELGAHLSIFATAGATEPDSAHLIHRNLTNADGAIVLDPDSHPHYLLMRFDEQTF